jgi:heme exporter protein D
MNWGEFFAMKGYALYIWGSYGMALLVFIVEVALVRHKRKITLQQLRLMRDSGGDEE